MLVTIFCELIIFLLIFIYLLSAKLNFSSFRWYKSDNVFWSVLYRSYRYLVQLIYETSFKKMNASRTNCIIQRAKKKKKKLLFFFLLVYKIILQLIQLTQKNFFFKIIKFFCSSKLQSLFFFSYFYLFLASFFTL